MRRALLWLGVAGAGLAWAARCTTELDSRAMAEFERYAESALQAARGRITSAELSWIPDAVRLDAARKLRDGKTVLRQIPLTVDERLPDWNGTVLHWAGAVVIRNTKLEGLRAVLEDFDRYSSIYRPMIFDCRARPLPDGSWDVTYGLQNVYRVAALFPQHYAFQIKARAKYEVLGGAAPALFAPLCATEIRESDSGVPGRDDFLEPHRDHGVMWALQAHWLARPRGSDVYLEFETITLARSIRDFQCRIGILPVPKAVAARAMASMPAESVELMLSRTRAECERRAARPAHASGLSSTARHPKESLGQYKK